MYGNSVDFNASLFDGRFGNLKLVMQKSHSWSVC
jgi:hypothetical protein